MSIAHVDLIGDALRLIGVLAETETASAEQGALGLRVVAEMLADWEADGVDLGYVPAAALADAVAADDTEISAIKYNLAHMLAGYYGRPTPAWVLERAQTLYGRLVRLAVQGARVEADLTNIPLGERNGRYDILAG